MHEVSRCQTCGAVEGGWTGASENVRGSCPKCYYPCCGVRFESQSGRQYEVPAHGRMGNKSYREDPIVAVVCPYCGSITQKEL